MPAPWRVRLTALSVKPSSPIACEICPQGWPVALVALVVLGRPGRPPTARPAPCPINPGALP
ncbi:unnamed protein product [[Actinomadura] parvosata subsp. kistnae]|nr:unnamed protein product [Actinomadura parvosata subsp. kistnae]